jgi:Domain of Unknown Function (DUF1080)
VLFKGGDLSSWQESKWRVIDGEVVAGEGSLVTRQEFGDLQLHVEWLAPAGFKGPWHDRGNNGVLLMGLFEIQIFDSHRETRHLALPEYRRKTSRGPLVLHGHNCPVRFRNVWVRPFNPPPAPVE